METERLTDHRGDARAPVVQGEPGAGAKLLAYVVDEAEVWLMDLQSGATRRIDDGRHAFCFDPAIDPAGTTVSWQAWSPPAMAWDAAVRVDFDVRDGRISTWRPADAAVQQPRFAIDGTPTSVDDRSGWLNVYVSDRAAAPERCEQALPTWAMGQRSYVDRGNDGVIFTRNRGGFGSICVADHSGDVWEIAAGVAVVYGHLSFVDDCLVALRSGPTTPAEIVCLRPDRGADNDPHNLAGSGVRAWTGVEIADPEPVEVDQDGTILHARRYRARRNTSTEPRMFCWIHGGPTDQWQVGFRPRIAYWVTRGWDVLVVDPRGTTGHGRAYQRALNGSWGRLDVDDTASLIRHAHRCGWATPHTTVAIGSSAGGLTVLGLLADHSDIVAGGVAAYPVSDLADLASSDHRFEAHYTETLIGPPSDTDLYEKLSPLSRAEQIAGPLLVFHGTGDPVVPVEQTRLLAERIRASGGEVECVIYDGEKHGFRDPDNQRDEYQRTERFVERVTSRA